MSLSREKRMKKAKILRDNVYSDSVVDSSIFFRTTTETASIFCTILFIALIAYFIYHVKTSILCTDKNTKSYN